jgi:predicted enzyme related to lactoylglutathione lyase
MSILFSWWKVFGALFLVVVFSQQFLFSIQYQDHSKPEVLDQVVFLYYSNLEKAAHFYESVMGFKQIEQTQKLEWVAIYRATEDSYVGIVDEKKGSLKTAQEKPVMLSWVTDDVDGWYEYLKKNNINIVRDPKTNPETGIRAMLLKDPGGYMLEFFQWMN